VSPDQLKTVPHIPGPWAPRRILPRKDAELYASLL